MSAAVRRLLAALQPAPAEEPLEEPSTLADEIGAAYRRIELLELQVADLQRQNAELRRQNGQGTELVIARRRIDELELELSQAPRTGGYTRDDLLRERGRSKLLDERLAQLTFASIARDRW